MGFNVAGDVGMELGISDGCAKRGVGYHNRKKTPQICHKDYVQNVHGCLTFTVGLAEGEALIDDTGKKVGAPVGP
jgi:hypothetical protein